MNASEIRALSDELEAVWKKQHGDTAERMNQLEAQMQLRAYDTKDSTPWALGKGPLLGLEQKLAPHWRDLRDPGFDAKDVRLGALLAAYAGLAGGSETALHALEPEERKAFNSLQGPTGDFLIAESVGSIFVDAVRPQLRVAQAGARSYPMESSRVLLPGWDGLLTASWRGEAGPFAASEGTFRLIALQARMLGCFVDISLELLEDSASNLSGVSSIVEAEVGRALAQEIDRVCLFGPGSSNEPLGLSQVDPTTNVVTALSGITQQAVGGADGGTPSSYDDLIDAVGTVRDANFNPNAAIYSTRTGRTLGKLKDSQQRYLQPPAYLDGISRLESNNVGNAYHKGTSTDCSVAFVGEWSNLVIGHRPDATVRVQRDPYTQMADAGAVRFVFYARLDVAVLNKSAFLLLDGIRP